MPNNEPQDTAQWRAHIDVLIDAKAIAERICALGKTISADYSHSPHGLVVVCVLKGSFPFFADLVRQIALPLTCEFIGVSSYGNAQKSSGVVKINYDVQYSIENKDVLIVEDIIDTGLSMRYLLDNFATRRPRSVKVCSLLQKPSGRQVPIDIAYLGFTIPDAFVVGYGLDYRGRLRNLPFVGRVHPEAHGLLEAALRPAGQPETLDATA